MARTGADILDVGMVSPLGLTAVTTAAAVRAGTSRYRDTIVRDRRFEPIVMSLIPTEDLPELGEHAARATRYERMLFLSARALREAVRHEARIPRTAVLLAVPDAHPGYPAAVAPTFLGQLARAAGVPFDLKRSRLFPNGRAGVFLALREALSRLDSGADERVVVGGVDTFLDPLLLLALDEEGRILASVVRDGFIPGEGAAFLLLAKPGTARRSDPTPLARIEAAAHAVEPGHRYSDEVYLGAGLDTAFERLFESAPPLPPVRTVYAGLTGESYSTREWGVSVLRHRERLAPDFALEHPADCFGDPGAALGAMMLGLSAIGIRRGYRQSPCLVWCSSDRAERGAALVNEA